MIFKMQPGRKRPLSPEHEQLTRAPALRQLLSEVGMSATM